MQGPLCGLTAHTRYKGVKGPSAFIPPRLLCHSSDKQPAVARFPRARRQAAIRPPPADVPRIRLSFGPELHAPTGQNASSRLLCDPSSGPRRLYEYTNTYTPPDRMNPPPSLIPEALSRIPCRCAIPALSGIATNGQTPSAIATCPNGLPPVLGAARQPRHIFPAPDADGPPSPRRRKASRSSTVTPLVNILPDQPTKETDAANITSHAADVTCPPCQHPADASNSLILG